MHLPYALCLWPGVRTDVEAQNHLILTQPRKKSLIIAILLILIVVTVIFREVRKFLLLQMKEDAKSESMPPSHVTKVKTIAQATCLIYP